MMKTTLKATKESGFHNIVLEVGNPEADENPKNVVEYSDEESGEDSDEDSYEEEYEDEQRKNLETVVDIISSKLWRHQLDIMKVFLSII